MIFLTFQKTCGLELSGLKHSMTTLIPLNVIENEAVITVDEYLVDNFQLVSQGKLKNQVIKYTITTNIVNIW